MIGPHWGRKEMKRLREALNLPFQSEDIEDLTEDYDDGDDDERENTWFDQLAKSKGL